MEGEKAMQLGAYPTRATLARHDVEIVSILARRAGSVGSTGGRTSAGDDLVVLAVNQPGPATGVTVPDVAVRA